jgi:hypothetical protein
MALVADYDSSSSEGEQGGLDASALRRMQQSSASDEGKATLVVEAVEERSITSGPMALPPPQTTVGVRPVVDNVAVEDDDSENDLFSFVPRASHKTSSASLDPPSGVSSVGIDWLPPPKQMDALLFQPTMVAPVSVQKEKEKDHEEDLEEVAERNGDFSVTTVSQAVVRTVLPEGEQRHLRKRGQEIDTVVAVKARRVDKETDTETERPASGTMPRFVPLSDSLTGSGQHDPMMPVSSVQKSRHQLSYMASVAAQQRQKEEEDGKAESGHSKRIVTKKRYGW